MEPDDERSFDGPWIPTELHPDWLAVLDAVAIGFRVASTRASLIAAGHTPFTLEQLLIHGWLVAWMPPNDGMKCLRPWVPKDVADVESLTFSPWAAEFLGVEVTEAGPTDRPRWAKAAAYLDDLDGLMPPSPLPSWGKLPEPPSHYEAAMFTPFRVPEHVPDPAKGPAELAEEREELAMRYDEVVHYDAEKDETRVEIVPSQLKVMGQPVPVDPKVKGKRAGAKNKAKAKGKRA